MSDFRVALIGAGRIAQAYMSAYRSLPGVRLVGVVDVQDGAARATAEAHGCPAFPSHQRLFEAVGVDAVTVCTPPSTHYPIAVEALEAGVHVLCEKPLAFHEEEVRRMIATARRAGKILMMASKFRYVRDVATARSIIRAGVLGTVVRYENTFASWLDVANRWNSDRAISGGGVLIDNGTHCADVMRYLIDPVKRVFACQGPRIQPIAVEDSAHVLAESTGGVVGTFDVSWSMGKERASFIEVFGTEGVLAVGWKESRYRQYRSTSWDVYGTGYDKQKAFEAQVANFVGACRGYEQPLVDSEDALASVLVIEAAYASLAAETWVEVKPCVLEKHGG